MNPEYKYEVNQYVYNIKTDRYGYVDWYDTQYVYVRYAGSGPAVPTSHEDVMVVSTPKHKIALCVIAPEFDIFASTLGDYVFLQADWTKHLWGYTLGLFNEKRNGKYLILDNQHPIDDRHTVGVFQDPRTLLQKAEVLNADEVVIPDALGNRLLTLANAYEFFNLGVPHNINYMFVPQGGSLEEWKLCLSEFLNEYYSRHVLTIGVPKWLGEQRWEAIKEIPAQYQVHFLGVRGGWGELEYHPRVRSWDTSLMYAAAQYDDKLPDSPRDFKHKLSGGRTISTSVLKYNIEFARSLLQEERVRDEP